MPTEHLRGDEPLVRHLAETHSPVAANGWQQLPYVQLPGDGFGQYLATHEQELEEALPTIEHLPWQDVVFDSVTARQAFLRTAAAGGRDEFGTVDALATVAEERGQSWFRVADGRRYLARAAEMSPWLNGPSDLLAFARLDPDAWLAVEVWEASTRRPDGTTGFALYPDVSLVRRADPWDRKQGWAHLYPNPSCRVDRAYGAGFCNLAKCQYPEGHPVQMQCVGSELMMATGVQIALETLAYLSASDEYVVAVKPDVPPPTRSPREARQAKVTAEKPWLRRNLPRYILIDPQRVGDYRATAPTPTGHHAAPRPHQRRGHWRELRSERYHLAAGSTRRVWVKQSWIGASEWVHEGQRYRVVPPTVS